MCSELVILMLMKCLTVSKLLLIGSLYHTNRASMYLRNIFHFSDIHQGKNAMGRMQTK